MQRFSKTTLALALAAGLLLPVLAPAGPALAHDEACPTGFVVLPIVGPRSEDRNGKNLLCAKSGLAPAHLVVIDDHVHSESVSE